MRKRKPYKPRTVTCKAKSKQSGQRCGNYPVPGKDVCRIHGGKTPLMKDGRGSKYPRAHQTLAEKYAEIENNPNILKSEEILKKYVVIAEVWWDKLKDLDNVTENDDLKSLIEILSTAINRAAYVEETKVRQGLYWSIQQMTDWIAKRLLPAVNELLIPGKEDEFKRRLEVIELQPKVHIPRKAK